MEHSLLTYSRIDSLPLCSGQIWILIWGQAQTISNTSRETGHGGFLASLILGFSQGWETCTPVPVDHLATSQIYTGLCYIFSREEHISTKGSSTELHTSPGNLLKGDCGGRGGGKGSDKRTLHILFLSFPNFPKFKRTLFCLFYHGHFW